jgi:hypothetical protein
VSSIATLGGRTTIAARKTIDVGGTIPSDTEIDKKLTESLKMGEVQNFRPSR